MLKIMIMYLLCDQYIIYTNAKTNWVVDYGDILYEAEADGDVYWMDENQNY